jgi:DNA-binding NarL/FixJ family response regulator
MDASKVLLDKLSQEVPYFGGGIIISQAQEEADIGKLIQAKNPEVVNLDFYLRLRNSINESRTIKEKNKSLIVIMLTNYPNPQSKRKCKALGANYFFVELTEIPKVIQTLRELNGREKGGNHETKNAVKQE